MILRPKKCSICDTFPFLDYFCTEKEKPTAMAAWRHRLDAFVPDFAFLGGRFGSQRHQGHYPLLPAGAATAKALPKTNIVRSKMDLTIIFPI